MGSSCCRNAGHIPHEEIILLHDQVAKTHASPKFGAQLENNATLSKERVDDCVSPIFGRPPQLDELNELPSIENGADIELSVSSLKSILKTELKYINSGNTEKNDRKVRFLIE